MIVISHLRKNFVSGCRDLLGERKERKGVSFLQFVTRGNFTACFFQRQGETYASVTEFSEYENK
jgi:hypothetical protein